MISADSCQSTNGKPRIERVFPQAAVPGGELQVWGSGFCSRGSSRALVQFGNIEGSLLIGSDRYLVTRVPDGAVSCNLLIANENISSAPFPVEIGDSIADEVHPVANPAVDHDGNIFVTYSGQRGQKVPVCVYKIDANYNKQPFLTEPMNPTGMTFDSEGYLYISSRNDGNIYRASPNGTLTVYAEGMGIATGLAFDHQGFLYVGDRSGTVFKISPDRKIFVFATLEPSISAYHLAFGSDGFLYITGPTTSSYDCVNRISKNGDVEKFYRGLGRPQGMAFDIAGNLYVAASQGGRKGIFRINPAKQCELVIAGAGLVGLAFTNGPAIILASNQSLFHLNWDVEGMPLMG